MRVALAAPARRRRRGRAEQPGLSMRAAARARVGFLGPAGTFSEEALLASAAPDAIEPVALASIYETVAALRRGEVRLGDRADRELARRARSASRSTCSPSEDGDVQIVGEALLRVRHSLIARRAGSSWRRSTPC